MKKTQAPKSWTQVVCATLLVCVATVALADVEGLIRTTEGRVLRGKIRWQPASKVYTVTAPNNVSLKIEPSKVARVQVQKPAGLDDAIKSVQTGQPANAIKTLEAVVTDYEMLQWDVEAARYLSEAYLKTGAPDKAISMIKRIKRLNPGSVLKGELARIYWASLLAVGEEAELEKALTDTIQGGDREMAAMAQVMRGDIQLQKGNFQKALIDGYLRTVVFYKEIVQVAPEALYKAGQCFEKLGQSAHAEKMRKQLLADYPTSSYAEKVKSGA